MTSCLLLPLLLDLSHNFPNILLLPSISKLAASALEHSLPGEPLGGKRTETVTLHGAAAAHWKAEPYHCHHPPFYQLMGHSLSRFPLSSGRRKAWHGRDMEPHSHACLPSSSAVPPSACLSHPRVAHYSLLYLPQAFPYSRWDILPAGLIMCASLPGMVNQAGHEKQWRQAVGWPLLLLPLQTSFLLISISPNTILPDLKHGTLYLGTHFLPFPQTCLPPPLKQTTPGTACVCHIPLAFLSSMHFAFL